MSVLFGVTELDFQLRVECSAFLDETWVIPVSPAQKPVQQVCLVFQVFVPHKLPPIKTLDIKVG